MAEFEEEMKAVEAYMERMRLPHPDRPEGFGETYEFPDDPETLSDTRLGQTMLKLAAYHGYSIRLLGVVDSELALLESLCKDAIAKLRVTTDLGKVTIDTVEATAAVIDPKIAELRVRKERRRVVQIRLKAYTEMYNVQYSALSREVSRRSIGYKMG